MALIMLLPAVAWGQMVQLWGDSTGRSIGLDLDRVWNYNLYEHSRWGLGGAVNIPLHRGGYERLSVAAYGGYGVQDRVWKYGVSSGVKLAHNGCADSVWGAFWHDYEAAGSRQMTSQMLTHLQGMSSFMSRRMSELTVATVGGSHHWDGLRLEVEGRLYSGGRLFDGERLRYRRKRDAMASERGAEVVLRARGVAHWAADLTLGGQWPQEKLVARLLAQYSNEWLLSPVSVSLFCQSGLTPMQTPYTRMFDLGGSYGGWICFDHTLLTVRPSELTANAFGLVCLQAKIDRAIVERWSRLFQIGYHIKPFVGLNGAWGTLWGCDREGVLDYEGLTLRAPIRGVAEAVVGADGLIRFGVVDWGAAVACRLTPVDDESNRLPISLLLTAKLIPNAPFVHLLK